MRRSVGMSGIRITGFHLAPRKTAARRVTLSNLWRRSRPKESEKEWYVGLSDLFTVTVALVAFGSDIEVVAAP